MAKSSTDCAFLLHWNSNSSGNVSSYMSPALQPNPDISGIGVLIGFVGTAYITFFLLVVRYIMGFPEDTMLDDSEAINPIDDRFIKFLQWMFRFNLDPKMSKSWASALRSCILAMSDTQIVTGVAILASGYSQLNFGLSTFHWQIVVYLAWFSSSTHLATMTFLRRYTAKNRGFRMLRIALMLVLVVMLAFALAPTGSNCVLYPPGFPVRCCFKGVAYSESGGGAAAFQETADASISMIASEIILVLGITTRCIKFFRTTSKKLVALSEWLSKKLRERFILSKSNSGMLSMQKALFLVLARVASDVVTSLLWEMGWLGFSLAWGTVRLFSARRRADADVILEEDFWAFGQYAPTLLLILPCLSFAEAWLDVKSEAAEHETLTPNPAHSQASDQDNHPNSLVLTALTANQDAAPFLKHPSVTTVEIDLGSFYVPRPRRTGTDLSNMEQLQEAGITPRLLVPGPPFELVPPTTNTTSPPSKPIFQLLHEDYEVYTEKWFQDLLTNIFIALLCTGILFISFSGSASGLNLAVGILFGPAGIWAIYLYFYTYCCIYFHFRHEKAERWTRFLKIGNVRVFRWSILVILNIVVLLFQFLMMYAVGLDG